MIDKIVFVMIIWLILAGDLCVRFHTKNRIFELNYNGVVWVALDRWSIWKYNSADKSIKWISVAISYKP